jgi:hypothetical protein
MQNDAAPRRAARQMIENHGSLAAALAEKRAAESARAGNLESADLWRKVAYTIRIMDPGQKSGSPR